jgi:hypothetical protein
MVDVVRAVAISQEAKTQRLLPQVKGSSQITLNRVVMQSPHKGEILSETDGK